MVGTRGMVKGNVDACCYVCVVGRRGLVMGLWNSHTSVGNIAGSVVAGAFVERDWALSFIVPGIIIILMSLPVLFFFVPRTFHNRHASGCWRITDADDLRMVQLMPLPPHHLLLQ